MGNKYFSKMNISVNKKLFLYITLFAVAISLFNYFFFCFFNNTFLVLIISLPIFFITIYFIINLLTKNYIKEKIKPIYKKTCQINLSLKNKNVNADEMLKKINQQINLSANNHTKEIKQLKELEKYRKEFIGNVSHELKTPIFNIQGYLLTLIDGGINDPNINELYLKRAEKSVDRMILIVNDLEAISKLEAGKLELNYDNFDIEELINDIFDMQMLRAKEKNISFNIINNLNKKLIVNADKKWISRLIINLIVNSINYGKNDGNTSISIKELENKYLIEISDNGSGISENELPRIFERFYRADKSRSREQGGTGLGLSIVKHIIEAHNQQITVESIVNKGTKFAFTLNKAK